MSYKHLSLEERYYLETAKKAGNTLTKIALDMGRSQSTLSRELSRNTGQRGYRHNQAMRLAQERQALKPKQIKLTEAIKDQIAALIRQEWSPEQIAGRLKLQGDINLHHETIYQYILVDKRAGGDLFKQLRHQNKTYRKRYGYPRNRTGIPNRVDIDNRPEIANQRGRVGDWEADTIIGKNHKGAIVTLDERKSKLRLAAPLQGKKARLVTEAMVKLLHPFQAFVQTITFDNGKEFTGHELIAEKLSCDTYFAKPYHSWERGQNENANGLLRQYFPKSMELIDVKNEAVIDAVHKLNNRPRKCLKFKTPYEVFEELTGIDAKQSWGYALMT
jgi:IS30 family transposase